MTETDRISAASDAMDLEGLGKCAVDECPDDGEEYRLSHLFQGEQRKNGRFLFRSKRVRVVLCGSHARLCRGIQPPQESSRT